IRPEQRDRLPRIAADTDLRIDFDFAEQWHPVSFGDAPSFAVAEDINVPLAMRATKETHVLHHAENVYIDLAKHFNRFPDIRQRNRGRCGDEYSASDRHELN